MKNFDYFKDIKLYLSYNKDTGKFFRIKEIGRKGKIGPVKESKDKDGYLLIKFGNKSYRTHRLAWYFVYEVMPKKQIDHINGNIIDNRIINLREVTNRKNAHNYKKHREGKLVGCSFDSKAKKWVAQIYINGKSKYLGLFKTEIEGHLVYMKEFNKLKDREDV